MRRRLTRPHSANQTHIYCIFLQNLFQESHMVQQCSKSAGWMFLFFFFGGYVCGRNSQLVNGRLWETADRQRQRCQRVSGSGILFSSLSRIMSGEGGERLLWEGLGWETAVEFLAGIKGCTVSLMWALTSIHSIDLTLLSLFE